MWIFGYGSLIWRPDLPFVERRRADLEGWRRRLWQASPDHRGTPESPGRVLTLVEEEGAVCRGVAYRLAPDGLDEVLADLDHREKAGYERRLLPLVLEDPAETVEALVYRAPPGNAGFLGPAPVAEMAEHIRRSSGPSGPNVEYVLELARALHDLGVVEDEVLEVAAALRATTDRPARARPPADRGPWRTSG